MKLVLPFPPSVNNLFFNPRGAGGRAITARYKKWRLAAAAVMWGQKIEMFSGPVRISMVFEDNGKCDLDNLQKAVIDHLVRYEIIKDDSRPYVRRLELEWGPVKGVEVEIHPHEMGP